MFESEFKKINKNISKNILIYPKYYQLICLPIQVTFALALLHLKPIHFPIQVTFVRSFYWQFGGLVGGVFVNICVALSDYRQRGLYFVAVRCTRLLCCGQLWKKNKKECKLDSLVRKYRNER